jgi:hypothetical protein
VYRLLHQVLVVVVSRAHSNVFSSLNLVAAISRLLIAEAKSIELTPERLLKKYAQVGRTNSKLHCGMKWLQLYCGSVLHACCW